MTAQQPATAFRPSADEKAFCALRSALIDEFARLEIAVGRCLARLDLGVDARKVCFDQRLTRLSNAKPCPPQLSSARAKALASLAQDCDPLQRIRASVVHSVMGLGTRDGEPVAFFCNVADAVGDDPVSLILTAAGFDECIKALKAMKRRVETASTFFATLPKPGAAAGP